MNTSTQILLIILLILLYIFPILYIWKNSKILYMRGLWKKEDCKSDIFWFIPIVNWGYAIAISILLSDKK